MYLVRKKQNQYIYVNKKGLNKTLETLLLPFLRTPLFFVHNVHLTLHETREFHSDTNTFHRLLFHLHRTETQSRETHLQFKFREILREDKSSLTLTVKHLKFKLSVKHCHNYAM